jgi:hypothetical protein
MFKTNEELIKNITTSEYDIFLRTRTDCCLEYIEIPENLDDDTYYVPYNQWGLLWDNLGLAKPNVFVDIWNTNNIDLTLLSPEGVLTKKVEEKYKVLPLNFKIFLYQSGDEFFMGIPQWSKRNRIFEYNNKWINYT